MQNVIAQSIEVINRQSNIEERINFYKPEKFEIVYALDFNAAIGRSAILY